MTKTSTARQNFKPPKILYVDIETSPSLGYVWGKYDQNVIEFTKEWNILCVGYKWHGGKTRVISLPDFKGYRRNKDNDKALITAFRDLLDKADIVVAHNGDEFDVKKLNSRITFHGLTPPSPYKTVDTCKVARKYFGFNSNKLNDLGQLLGLGKKVETGGFQLWKRCIAGDMSAWRRMIRYNKQDVDLLQKVYLHFLPWIEHHPSYGAFVGKEVCNKCGGEHLIGRGYAIRRKKKVQRFQCQSCGGWQQQK